MVVLTVIAGLVAATVIALATAIGCGWRPGKGMNANVEIPARVHPAVDRAQNPLPDELEYEPGFEPEYDDSAEQYYETVVEDQLFAEPPMVDERLMEWTASENPEPTSVAISADLSINNAWTSARDRFPHGIPDDVALVATPTDTGTFHAFWLPEEPTEDSMAMPHWRNVTGGVRPEFLDRPAPPAWASDTGFHAFWETLPVPTEAAEAAQADMARDRDELVLSLPAPRPARNPAPKAKPSPRRKPGRKGGRR